MTTSILVTGGTGTLGRPVAQRLRDADASVTVLSRHPAETADGIRYTVGDLSTGAGIAAAVRGAEVIVHCAGSSKGDEQKTRTLVSAAKDARHIVLISRRSGPDPAGQRDRPGVVRLLRHEAGHRAAG